MSGLDVAVRPILENNSEVLNGRYVIKKALSERCFIAHCPMTGQDVIIKGILLEENIEQWIDLPLHTNVITAFDQFQFDNKQFQITEYVSQSRNMYEYIASMKLNLALSVPKAYLETIFDCATQMAIALEFSHS